MFDHRLWISREHWKGSQNEVGASSRVSTNYRVSQKKHSYKIFGLEIMLFTCSQTLWSGLRSSFTKWGTAPAFTTACKTTMSASRWRAWSLVQKFYKSVFSGTPCSLIGKKTSWKQEGWGFWLLHSWPSKRERREGMRPSFPSSA